MRVLNLYAGIGGNRKLWTDVEVTAVEMNPKIAEIYQDFFPGDKVIITDAHQYLLDNFAEYDFIWSSPPCPTHSRFNLLNNERNQKGYKYPDMTLYQEILLLKHWFKGKYCVENVISYYKPLIKPTESNNHFFWVNFHFAPFKNIKRGIRREHLEYREALLKKHGISLSKYNITLQFKKRVLNNCVEPELGLHILNESKRDLQPELFRS